MSVCVCDLLLSECSSKYKSDKKVVLCLVSLHKGVSHSTMSSLQFGERKREKQREGETDSSDDVFMERKQSKQQKHEKIQFFAEIRADDENRKQSGLSCITILQRNIFCLFWSAKHMCRFVGLPQTNLHHNRMEHGSVL